MPIIMLLDHGQVEAIRLARHAGVRYSLHYPCDPHSLIALIAAALAPLDEP